MQTADSSRIFGLDLLRAVAILSVVIGHGLPILGAANTQFPWIPTGDGVDMFFVLSGYLIGGILISSFVVPKKLGVRDLGHFLKRRWFRTLPNYYLILLLNIGFAWLSWNMGNLDFFSWKFFAFLQNLAWKFEGFFWESWSLAVEEWFYFSFPILLLLGSLLIRDVRTRKWLFISAVFLFLLLPMLLRILNFDPAMDRYQWDIGVRKVVIYRLDSIAFGLAMVCIARFLPRLWRVSRWPVFIFGFALFIFLDNYRQPVSSTFVQVWVFSLSSLAYACWLPLLSQIPTAPSWIMRPIRHISLISYSMYLIHLGLISEVIQKWYLPATAMGAWLTYLLYFTLVIVLSTLLYYAWERPMMNLRERF
jgi:peptidoglycan/LPS O-acetylase OafA/YrhL